MVVRGRQSPAAPTIKSGRHDAAALRHSKRAGRERGCWVYVPAEQLVECGLNPYEPPPDYRVYAARRPNGKPKKTLLVQLYEADSTLPARKGQR